MTKYAYPNGVHSVKKIQLSRYLGVEEEGRDMGGKLKGKEGDEMIEGRLKKN